MAVTAKVYNAAVTALANKEIDWGSDTIKVVLLAPTYTPDQAAHDYYDDISAHEVANGNGYTTGGVTLTNKTEAFVGQVKKFDADDTIWAAPTTLAARYAALVDTTPATAGTKPLIAYADFGETVSSTNGEFKIQWHADGIFKVTVA